MELLTKELIEQFCKTGRQENVEGPVVIAKFFNPCGSQTWLATEYYPDDRLFYGYVSLFNDPMCNEFGYFSLDELEAVRTMPFGLGIERDLYFESAPLSVVKRREKIH